jgi:hypothetical protein
LLGWLGSLENEALLFALPLWLPEGGVVPLPLAKSVHSFDVFFQVHTSPPSLKSLPPLL